jgi:hypothetical protein
MPWSNPGSPTRVSELVPCEKTQPGYERAPGRNRRVWQPGPVRKTLRWVAFALLLLLTAFVFLAFCLQVVHAITGNVQKGESRGGAAGAAVLLLAIALALGWFARWVEQKAREHLPVGKAPQPHRPRRHTPHSNRFAFVVLAVLMVIFSITTVVGFVNWHRSQSVQHHGLQVNGIVTQVQKISHSTRGGSYQTYNISVGLLSPVLGHSTATVHTPDKSPPALVGETVAVRLDRSDPSYAEIPGDPANSIWAGVVGLILLAIIGAGLVVGTMTEHRRRSRAAAGVAKA